VSQDFYEELSAAGWGSLEQPRTKVALELVRSVPATRVLDVGCGDGAVSVELARTTGAAVIGIDISHGAVAVCRQRGLEAHRVALGTEPIPVADRSLDLVYMAEVLEHLPRPDRAIEEIRRVLRPRGHLVLTTPNLACLPNRALILAGLQPLYTEVSEDRVLGRMLSTLGQGGRPVGHLRIYTKRALCEFMEMHAFRIVRVRGAAFHCQGVRKVVEDVVGWFPSVAMQLVLLCQKKPSDGR
jgi:ubiquinone/menaquinone biosynthesis C-methylase UbiE